MSEPNNTTATTSNRSSWLVILLIVGGLIVAGLFAYVTATSTQPIFQVGRQFLDAMVEEDYATAYTMMAPSLRERLGSASEFAELFVNSGLPFVNYEIPSAGVGGDEAFVSGGMVLADNTRFSLRVGFRRAPETDIWRVITFELRQGALADFFISGIGDQDAWITDPVDLSTDNNLMTTEEP